MMVSKEETWPNSSIIIGCTETEDMAPEELSIKAKMSMIRLADGDSRKIDPTSMITLNKEISIDCLRLKSKIDTRKHQEG